MHLHEKVAAVCVTEIDSFRGSLLQPFSQLCTQVNYIREHFSQLHSGVHFYTLTPKPWTVTILTKGSKEVLSPPADCASSNDVTDSIQGITFTPKGTPFRGVTFTPLFLNLELKRYSHKGIMGLHQAMTLPLSCQ